MRIYFVGSHATGKTTLCRYVSRRYNMPMISEVARAILAEMETALEALRTDFADEGLRARITDEQFLQGPLSDAMTHAGQLAMLRRLAGHPVPPENFVFAEIDQANVGPDQPEPARPDEEWPERP